jgi:hypothetical protein
VHLVGHVHCRCWQDGLSTAPPVDPALILVDDDGALDLDLPDPADEDDDEYADEYAALEEWESGSCAHPGRWLVVVWVATWDRYLPFRRDLERGDYPALTAGLPSDLYVWTDFPVESAKDALAELVRFRAATTVARLPVLVDDDTGTALWGDDVWAAALGRDNEFAWGLEHAFGVDEDGFFVRDKYGSTSDGEVFRAARFTQHAVGDRFALDSGEQRIVLPGKPFLHVGHDTPPRQLRTEIRDQRVVVHADIVDRLTELLETAARTGFSVIWRRE